MTVQSETTQPHAAPVRTATARRASSGTSVRALAAKVGALLPADGERFAASAPGRLDVMGGSADYAGSLVVDTPTARQACVAVQRRTDGKLVIMGSPVSGPQREATKHPAIPMTALNGTAAPSPERAASLLGTQNDESACGVLAAVACLLGEYATGSLAEGLSVAYDTAIQHPTDASATALAAATVTAVAAAFRLSVDPPTAATLCQRAAKEWLDVSVGAGEVNCSLSGRANALAHGRADSVTPPVSSQLPANVALIGIDSGVRHPRAVEKYRDVRTASFMGGTLIDRIVTHEGVAGMTWDGHVACVPITHYVERFRDRIPTKLAGREFLDLFGDIDDPLTTVIPDRIYKVRSRTEHHIYENARAVQFVERLRDAAIKPGDGALLEAGELMYASHWSYGQRCGLGSVETDVLVNLVRQFGRNGGVFGARISGRGCGGVVVVLMRAGDKSLEAVEAAIEAYQTRTGQTATLLAGSANGAMVEGAIKL